MRIEAHTHGPDGLTNSWGSQIATRQGFWFNENAFDENATAMYIPFDGLDDFSANRPDQRKERGAADGSAKAMLAFKARTEQHTIVLFGSGTMNRRLNNHAGCFPESVIQ